MRALFVTTALTAVLAATSCSTEPGVIHARTVDLHREASADGEHLDAFVVRIAPRAIEASKAARATICGQVVESNGRFTIQMKTDGYFSECTLSQGASPYVLVNGTANDARENHFSQVNWQRAGYLVTPWSVKYQDGTSKRPRTVR
ncbi:hypothetical protein [Stenotrophomonas sp. GZD-301]|uniref:hypothetical protein n=1 Tax=Stenotrophomonas sp. GZD-301 TaxID=3404814 RepID=UPI003BB75CB1